MISKKARLEAAHIEADLLAKQLASEDPPPTYPKCGRPFDVIDVLRYPGRWEWSGDERAYNVVTLNPAEEYPCRHCKKTVGGRYGNGSKWGFDVADDCIDELIVRFQKKNRAEQDLRGGS